jgi:hypothetical protein
MVDVLGGHAIIVGVDGGQVTVRPIAIAAPELDAALGQRTHGTLSGLLGQGTTRPEWDANNAHGQAACAATFGEGGSW